MACATKYLSNGKDVFWAFMDYGNRQMIGVYGVGRKIVESRADFLL